MPEPTDSVFIRHLTPRNFLSFGPDNPGIALKPLNLFIGPNGSGKSNLIEAISLMRAAPKEFRDVTRKGGGVGEWTWKGCPQEAASVEWVVSQPKGFMPLRHRVAFRSVAHRFALEDEWIEDAQAQPGQSEPEFYYRYEKGQPVANTADNEQRRLPPESIERDRSILAQRRDPETYPELAWLAQNYERVRIYREWAFGRDTVFRQPQQADMRRHLLEEDFSNLGLFLNRLKTEFPAVKRAILKALQDLYDGISDFEVNTNGGAVMVYLHEGDFAIPAPRLSDGTLRYLCLLAILFDPRSPTR